MKKIKKALSIILSAAMIFTSISVTGSPVKAETAGYVKVEMENMQINRARIKENAADSNGKHIEVFWQEDAFQNANDIANQSYVRMVVNAATAGEYTFKIGCTTWGDVSARMYVNSEKTDLTIPSGTAQEYEVTVKLNEGKNAVLFSWINWSEMDYIMVPDTLSVVSDATDTYYPASTAYLNMTWFHTDESTIYNPDALLYTGTLYLNVDENSGQPGDEEWQPSATFTVNAPNVMKSLKLEYYIEDEGTPNSEMSLIINGGEPLAVPIDDTGITYVSTEDLTASGFVLGQANTIKIQQKNKDGGTFGLYSLKEIIEDEPVSDDAVKTAQDLVKDGNIRMLGRTLTEGTSQTMDWTCSGFSFEYTGAGTVSANITTGNVSKLVVDINGTIKTKTVRRGTSNVELASNLTNGTYTIKVYKVTEANGYLTKLNSISYDKDAALKATKEADLKFEFIGDSITCGNQINSETGDEDGYGAYASVLARAYGADWNTISCSGRGLMEGFNSEEGWAMSQNAQMKDVFDYVSYFRDKETKYDYSYQPDVLVINLGSNDLGEEIMTEFGTTMSAFCEEVKAFSQKVRAKYPDTKIIWCYGTYYNNADADKYAEAVASLNDSSMAFVNFPQLLGGKDGHPNYTQQTRMAKILSAKVSEMLKVTNPMSSDLHYEAEAGTITVNGTEAKIKVETDVTPYSGNAYAADMNADVTSAANGAYVTVPVTVSKAGIYKVTVSYGSGAEKNPIVGVKSNNYAWSTAEITPAAGWDMIKTFDKEIYLRAGKNTVSITGAINGAWANIDCFELEYLRAGTEPGEVETPTNPPTDKVPDTTKKPIVTTKAPAVKAPAKAKLGKVTNIKGRKIKVSLKKVKKAAGYQIQYSLNKKFKKGTKKVSVKKLTYTTKKLKKKKTYYVRARAYVQNGKKKVYGSWSNVKKVKIKK